MQAVLTKWRSALILRNALPTHSSSSSATQFVSFHSTPIFCEKWRSKWNSEVRKEQRPSKTHNKYQTRLKRAEAKKALHDLLYKGRCSDFLFQYDEPTSKANRARYCGEAKEQSFRQHFNKRSQSKSSARHARRAHYKRRKLRRKGFQDYFDDHPDTVFRMAFGNNRWGEWESSFRSSTAGFEWREQSDWKHRRQKQWETCSESESDDDSNLCIAGSCSDRTMLGLPQKGPLKLEDVKTAFRSSALKWHPDKHQGPSQAMAAEKFKLCVDAYQSLCVELSPAA